METGNEDKERGTGHGGAMNALRYGLTAQSILIPGENGQSFIDLQNDFQKHFAPVGEYELFLVSRIIIVTWRLIRCERTEAAIFRHQLLMQNKHEAQEDAGKFAKVVTPSEEMFPNAQPRLKVQDAQQHQSEHERIESIKQSANAPETATGGVF